MYVSKTQGGVLADGKANLPRQRKSYYCPAQKSLAHCPRLLPAPNSGCAATLGVTLIYCLVVRTAKNHGDSKTQ